MHIHHFHQHCLKPHLCLAPPLQSHGPGQRACLYAHHAYRLQASPPSYSIPPLVCAAPLCTVAISADSSGDPDWFALTMTGSSDVMVTPWNASITCHSTHTINTHSINLYHLPLHTYHQSPATTTHIPIQSTHPHARAPPHAHTSACRETDEEEKRDGHDTRWHHTHTRDGTTQTHRQR